jgi:hypothetical protein
MPVVINGDTGITQAGEFNSDSSFGFKNRLINGGMVIDQRNAGASVTPTTNGTYTVDRWKVAISQASKFSVQRSSVAPTGFSNSLLATSLSSYTVGSSEVFQLVQAVEGFNFADFAWGSASGSPAVLSFWVRSSLTGTFGGSLTNGNSAATASYPFSFSISAANTWEQKSVSISCPTIGTWNTDNSTSFNLRISLGTGSTYQGTAGTWVASDKESVTGETQIVATNGATFYITGVQLEKGSTATSFDFRSYGTELHLCQRYFYNLTNCAASAASTTKIEFQYQHPVPMRGTPSLNVVGVMRIEDPSVAAYSQSSATSTLEQPTYLGMKPGFGNFTGLTVARPYYVAASAANVTASPPTGLCQVSAEL